MNGNPPNVLVIACVANIIPTFRLVGVAPDAQILSFKVFSDVWRSMLFSTLINARLTSYVESLGY
jgi:hypothetical protein